MGLMLFLNHNKSGHRQSKPAKDEGTRFKWPCWLLDPSFDRGQNGYALVVEYNYVWIYKSLSNESWKFYIHFTQFTRKGTNFLVNYRLLERRNEISQLSNWCLMRRLLSMDEGYVYSSLIFPFFLFSSIVSPLFLPNLCSIPFDVLLDIPIPCHYHCSPFTLPFFCLVSSTYSLHPLNYCCCCCYCCSLNTYWPPWLPCSPFVSIHHFTIIIMYHFIYLEIIFIWKNVFIWK